MSALIPAEKESPIASQSVISREVVVGAMYLGTPAAAMMVATFGSPSRGFSGKEFTLPMIKARSNRLAAIVKTKAMEGLLARHNSVRTGSHIVGHHRFI